MLSSAKEITTEAKWKVLIVDDDEVVHSITKLVFEDYILYEKSIEFLSAYTAEEAMRLVRENPGIALIIIDIVMEADDSGFKVIEYIRNVLNNKNTRIIVRTGQPGQAPEDRVVIEYDINDFKEKTELTSQKLFTSVTIALRTYRELVENNLHKLLLEQVIHSSAKIFRSTSLSQLAEKILIEINSLISINRSTEYVVIDGFVCNISKNSTEIIAATGKFNDHGNLPGLAKLPRGIQGQIGTVVKNKQEVEEDEYFIKYIDCERGNTNLLYITGLLNYTEWEKKIISLFCSNLPAAFDHIYTIE